MHKTIRKQIGATAFLFFILVGVVAFVQIPQATAELEIFEGFENWNLYGWSITASAGNTVEVNNASAMFGSYGLKCSVTGNNQAAYIRKNAGPSNYKEISGYFKFSALDTYGAGGLVIPERMWQISDSSTNALVYAGVMGNATANYFYMKAENGATDYESAYALNPTVGTVYFVNLSVSSGASGFAQFSVNGTQYANVAVDNSGVGLPSDVWLGFVNVPNDGDAVNTAQLDGWTVRNSDPEPTATISGYLLTDDFEYSNSSLFEPENWRYYYYNTTVAPANITDRWAFNGTNSLDIIGREGFTYRARDFLNTAPTNTTYTTGAVHCTTLNSTGVSNWNQGFFEGRNETFGSGLFFIAEITSDDGGAEWNFTLAHFNMTTGAHNVDNRLISNILMTEGNSYILNVTDSLNGTHRIQSMSINGSSIGTLTTEDAEQLTYSNFYAGSTKETGLQGTPTVIELDVVSVSLLDNGNAFEGLPEPEPTPTIEPTPTPTLEPTTSPTPTPTATPATPSTPPYIVGVAIVGVATVGISVFAIFYKRRRR